MTDLARRFGVALSAMRLALSRDTYATLPASCDVMLLCHDNDRALERFGRAYSQLLDTAGDKLAEGGYSVASVAARLSVLTGDKAHRNPVSINRGVLVAMARDRIEALFCFGRSQPARAVRPSRSMLFWLGLLRRHRPRVVVGIGLPAALCRAAKELGVTTIEVMHGFGLPPDDWVHGAAARTRLSDDDEPHLFIAYDQMTLDTIRLGSRGKKSAAVLARPPTLEVPPDANDLPDFLASLRRTRRGTSPYEVVALLTLQHGYDGGRSFLAGIIPNGILHPDIEEVIRSDPKIYWLIKLHPVQLRGAVRDGVASFMRTLSQLYANIEWERSSTAAVSDLLQVCDVHVTMSSGTVYEAAMSGVASAAFCPTVRPGGYLQTYFEDLVRAGWVTKAATDAASLHRWIRTTARGEAHARAGLFGEIERLPTTADVVQRALERGLE